MKKYIIILIALIIGANLSLGQNFKEILAKANKGNSTAQCRLGQMYFFGNGVEKDYKKSAYWIKKSAKKGVAEAQAFFGALYKEGNGVKKDSKKSLYWTKKSAEQGFPPAGVKKDFKKGLYWMKKACDNGFKEACEKLK